MPRHRTSVAHLILVLLLGASACTSGEEAADPASAVGASPAADGATSVAATAGLDERQRDHLVQTDATTWDVTLQDDATVVPGDVAVTTAVDGQYSLDTEAAAAAGITLEEGHTLLLAGRAVRRITAVSTDGETTTVSTEAGSLADVIEDGAVAWDVPIGFGFDQFVTEQPDDAVAAPANRSSTRAAASRSTTRAAALGAQPVLTSISTRMPDGRVLPVAADGDVARGIWDSIEIDEQAGSVSWEYTVDATRYRLRLTSAGDTVEVLVVVSRGAEGEETMAFRAEGSIGALRSTADSSWAGGDLASSDVALEQLAADVDVSLAVAGAGVSPIDFTIPVPMLTYTWLVGPVPVTLDLTAEIIGNVNAQANAAATAEASFSYRGDAGFTFGGADVATSGNTAIAEMDPEPADSSAGMGLDVDAQFGIGFPHVTLSVLGQGLVPEMRVGHVIGSSLQWGGPAAGFPASSLCKRAYVRQIVSGGYEFSVLGVALASNDEPFVLYEDERRTTGDSCPDED